MPPGRPADAQHRRMRIILGTLAAHRAQGVSRRTIMSALGKDPSSDSDQRVVARDLANLRASGWHIETEKVGLEDRYRLRVVDHRLRSAFSDQERAQLLRAARAAELGQIFDDLDPTTADGPDTLGQHHLGDRPTGHRGPQPARLPVHRQASHAASVRHRAQARWLATAGQGGRVRPGEGLRAGTRERPLRRPAGDRRPSAIGSPPLNIDPLSRHEHPPVEVVVRHAPELAPDVVSQLGAGGHRTIDTDDPGLVDSILTVTFLDSFLDRLVEMETRVRLISPASVRVALRERLLGTSVLQSPLSSLDQPHARDLDIDDEPSSFGARTASPQVVQALGNSSRQSGRGRRGARQLSPRPLTMPTEISA